MGLKEIIINSLDNIPGTDPLPGSNLGRRVRQLDSAPERIRDWAKAELEKERQKFRQPQKPQTETTLFTSEDAAKASLTEFPQLYINKRNKNK